MRPHVVVHAAVSADGSTTGFEPDVARFYELAQTWREDLTLAGADTILAQEPALAAAPRPGPAPDGPLLAVVDGRERVRAWGALRDCGHWSGVVALRAGKAGVTDPPGSQGSGDGDDEGRAAGRAAQDGDGTVPEIVTGDERVDLRAALDALAEREGIAVVRVDSGGRLNGALLRADAVSEISLLVHPCLAGDGGRPWTGPEPIPALGLARIAAERLDGGLDWLRWRVA